jgi:hypothetical protein
MIDAIPTPTTDSGGVKNFHGQQTAFEQEKAAFRNKYVLASAKFFDKKYFGKCLQFTTHLKLSADKSKIEMLKKIEEEATTFPVTFTHNLVAESKEPVTFGRTKIFITCDTGRKLSMYVEGETGKHDVTEENSKFSTDGAFEENKEAEANTNAFESEEKVNAAFETQNTLGTDARKKVETGFYVAQDKDGKKAVLHVKAKQSGGDQGEVTEVAKETDAKVTCDTVTDDGKLSTADDAKNCASPNKLSELKAVEAVCKEEGGAKNKLIIEAGSKIYVSPDVKAVYTKAEFDLQADKIHTLEAGKNKEDKKVLGGADKIEEIKINDKGKIQITLKEEKYKECVADPGGEGGMDTWQILLIVGAVLAVVVVAVVMLMPSAEDDEDDDEDDDDEDESDKNEP